VSLTRVNMPFLLLVAVAAACMGMLNAMRRFFVPASSPALYNVVFILCILVLVPLLKFAGLPEVMALSTGMLLGGVAQIAVQWVALRQEGYRHEWRLDVHDPSLREMLVLMGPGTLGAAAAQVNLLVNTWLSTHTDGAPTSLGYAFRMMYMPIGIFGVAIATAAVPELARHAAAGAHDAMRSTLSWGLRLMLMLSVPATVGLMVLAKPIVELLFQYRAFTAESTMMTASAIIFYAPGIVGYSVVKLASPGFYSLKDAMTPMVVSIISIAANLVLNLWLNGLMGYTGLALGTAIAANLNAGLLLVLLNRRLGGIDGRRVAGTFVKVAIASAAMGAIVLGVDTWMHAAFWPSVGVPSTGLRLLRVLAGISVGIVSIAIGSWLLRISEFEEAMGRLFRPRR
jgi:putative peptidoglycan lipid II flippase